MALPENFRNEVNEPLRYEVIATGSTGNAVLIGRLLIDCGVSAVKLKPYIGEIDYVYITHLHKDHITDTAVRYLAKNNVKFLTHYRNKKKRKGNPLYTNKDKIEDITYIEDEHEFEDVLGYSYTLKLGIALVHNAHNFSLHIHYNDLKIFYMTDGGTLKNEEALNYDYYFIENNYKKKKIYSIINNLPPGAYNRYGRSLREHLSKEQADKFYRENSKENSKYIRLHMSSKAY